MIHGGSGPHFPSNKSPCYRERRVVHYTVHQGGAGMVNRRVHPRLTFELNEFVKIPNEKKVPILDISKGGVCILFLHEYQIGDNITVRIGNLTMTLEVLDSRLMEFERDLDDFRYKTRCRHVSGDVLEFEPFCEVLST